MTYRPNRRLEVMARVAVVFVMLLVVRRVYVNDVSWYWMRAHGVGLHHLPYRNFLWEFPPLTTVVMPLVWLSAGSLTRFSILFGLAMAAVEYGSLEVLRRAFADRARAITSWWTLFMLPLGAICYFRLDYLSVLPACVALAALVHPSRRASGSIVAGVAAKLWPALFVVPLAAQRRWREVSVSIGATVIVFAGWWAFSPSGFADFLRFRKGSGVQIESTAGALLHLMGARPAFVSGAWVVGGRGWGWVDPLGMLVVGGVAAALVLWSWWRRRALEPVALTGGLVLLLLLGSRLFSPQYLVWAVPFVVLLAVRGEHRLATGCIGAAAALTLVSLYDYGAVVYGSLPVELAIVARNVLLVVAAVSMLRGAVTRAPADSVPELLAA